MQSQVRRFCADQFAYLGAERAAEYVPVLLDFDSAADLSSCARPLTAPFHMTDWKEAGELLDFPTYFADDDLR